MGCSPQGLGFNSSPAVPRGLAEQFLVHNKDTGMRKCLLWHQLAPVSCREGKMIPAPNHPGLGRVRTLLGDCSQTYVAICVLLPDLFSLACKALSCLDLLVITEEFLSGCGLFLPAYTLAPQPRFVLGCTKPYPYHLLLEDLASTRASQEDEMPFNLMHCVVLKWLFA